MQDKTREILLFWFKVFCYLLTLSALVTAIYLTKESKSIPLTLLFGCATGANATRLLFLVMLRKEV